MSLNHRCPYCGSDHVQLSNVRGGHGCLWTILFGIYYVIWVFIKWIIGIILFFIYDWWVAIIQSCRRRGHIWQCKKWFSGTRRYYYCHSCRRNFKA